MTTAFQFSAAQILVLRTVPESNCFLQRTHFSLN